MSAAVSGWHKRTRHLAAQMQQQVQSVERTMILPATDLPGYLLACAYPDRVARKRLKGSYQLANGRSVSFTEKHLLEKHTWLAVAEVTGTARSRGDTIRTATPLKPKLFEGALAELVSERTILNWDKKADRFLAERPNHRKEFQRLKGLGEMDWQELRETTIDPETRTLLQVTVEEAAEADMVMSVLMGDDVESRRNFITTNARDVRNLDF